MLRWSFTDQQLSYLCRFPENVNQSKSIGGNYLLIDLTTERIFIYVNLLPKFKLLIREKKGLSEIQNNQ